MEYKLSIKDKRLLSRLSKTELGLYWENLDQGDRERAERMVKLKLVEKTYGSWTGELIYRISPHLGQ